MTLKSKYGTLDEVPEKYRDLFTETSDGVRLTGVEGIKTDQDVSTLQEALRKEREDHKATKRAVQAWGDLNPADVLPKLDRIEELEAASKGKIDEAAIDEIVERRMKSKTAPLERKINELTTERDQLSSQVTSLGGELTSRDRSSSVRQIALEMKILPTAIADLEMTAERMLDKSDDGSFVVKDGVSGIMPGLDVKGFLMEMQKSRPHWWPQSQGGGATGGGNPLMSSDNPFTKDNWNMTKQGELLRSNPQMAEKMAAAAGTTIGGLPPTK